MTHTPDPMIVDTVDRLLASVCDSERIAAVERGEPATQAWEALVAGGINRAWLAEDMGGIDAGVADVCAIARLSGRHALPAPLADGILAARLLAECGETVADVVHALSVAPAGEDPLRLANGRLEGVRRHVPFARFADVLVVHAETDSERWLARLEPAQVRVESGRSLAGEPLDTVRFDAVAPEALHRLSGHWAGDAVRLAGALLRAQQMTGALERVLEMSVEYAQERVAFGRPIARFQAVQHNLAMLAGEVAAATAAANGAMLACAEHGFDDEASERAVASAKIRVGEAAGAGAAIAHQVHGAMGFTFEHRLHQFTRRLWSWRDEYGQETEWAIRLGRMVARDGAERLWPSLTDA